MANGEVSAYVDSLPTHAKSPELRPGLEENLRDRLVGDVPAMVLRLSELKPIITREVGEYLEFMHEAQWAFAFGLLRAVVALIGIAAESFTDNLYGQIDKVGAIDGKEIAKKELFGERLDEKRRLEILRFSGLITSPTFDKLWKVKKLRDVYVHGQGKDRDVGKDARDAMRLFRGVLNERFDAKYTIKEGRIVERQPDNQHTRVSS